MLCCAGILTELGGKMPKLSEILFGKEEKREKFDLFTPEQNQYMDFLLQSTKQPISTGLSYLQDLLGGGEESFQRMAAPEMRRFQEQVIPELAQRFASSDALGSSAFKQSLGAAGAGLSENLAALRENLRMQALQQVPAVAGMGQAGLQRRFENVLRPGTSGLAGPLLGAVGTALGGPLGGMIGSSVGGLFSKGGGGGGSGLPSMNIPSGPFG